jgi:hypothetical protein
VIPSFRLVEDIPDWGALVELVGGEHHGARMLLVPVARVLPRATTGTGRPESPVRRPLRLVGDRVPASPGGRQAEANRRAEADRRAEANRRAEALLESLLDDDQRADWLSRRRFWVPTPFGAVELGRVSDLRFDDLGGRHLVLCVVPQRSSELPDADIWTNLLLVLRGEPRRFFDVANYRFPAGPWHTGPVPLRRVGTVSG